MRSQEYRAGYKGDGFSLRHEESSPERPLMLRAYHWSPELERAVRDSGATTISVEPQWDGMGHGLSFLEAGVERIRRLGIGVPRRVGLASIAKLRVLTELGLSCPVDTLDFAALPSLRWCGLSHPSSVGSVAQCVGLEGLRLSRAKLGDLTSLASLTRLRSLQLSELSIATLDGIEHFSALEEVELTHLRRLRRLSPLLALPRLRRLTLDGSAGLEDLERVSEAGALELLHLIGTAELPSWEPIGRLERLRELGVWRTPVRDASVAPLVGLRALRTLKLMTDLRQAPDFERVGEIGSLEALMFERAPTLPSLRFLAGLHELRELGIWKTKIVDGDLRVLLRLPVLREVHAVDPPQRHYSHTVEQLNALLAARA